MMIFEELQFAVILYVFLLFRFLGALEIDLYFEGELGGQRGDGGNWGNFPNSPPWPQNSRFVIILGGSGGQGGENTCFSTNFG